MPVLSPEVQHTPAGIPPLAKVEGISAVPATLSLGTRLRAAAEQAEAALTDLAGRPVCFFLALLAINALALPYAGFRQDARLYAFQALNVLEGGRFGDDLFFRYGSQDQFSLFSLAARPLLRVTGVPLGFFLLYLISSALFLFALVRFVQAVVPHRSVAAWGLVFLVVSRIPFGGVETFHIGESFLTPRLASCALVLFGLERLLSGRPLVAAGFLLPALLLHPLMAFGGWLILLGWAMLKFLPRRWLWATLVVAAAFTGAVLLYEPLGARLLGVMDAEWYELVRRANPYQMSSEWWSIDWFRVAVASAVAGAAWHSLGQSPHIQRFLVVLLAVCALGVAGTILACWLPYALPLQAQPYRVLWLLQMLQVPLSFFLLGRWRIDNSVPGWTVVVGIAGCLTLLPADSVECLPLLVAGGLFAVSHWATPGWKEHETVWPSLAYGVLAGVALWVLLQGSLIVRNWHEASGLIDPIEFPRALSQLLSPSSRVLAGAALVLLAARGLGHGTDFQACMIGVWLSAHLGSFAVPAHWAYAERFQPHREELEFLQQRFGKPRFAPKPLTVYWPGGSVEYLWQDLRVNCYFNFAQLSGNSFSRGTALEGQRRLELVRPFEVDSWRRYKFLLNDLTLHILREMFQSDLESPPPTRDDLVRLCQDPVLDYVVARQRFDGLYAATHGAWFLYDCRDLRTRLARPPVVSTPSEPCHPEQEGNP